MNGFCYHLWGPICHGEVRMMREPHTNIGLTNCNVTMTDYHLHGGLKVALQFLSNKLSKAALQFLSIKLLNPLMFFDA